MTTLKFVREELDTVATKAVGRESSKQEARNIQSPSPETWIVDYPLIAYNSYKPDNSEIVICNFAEKKKQSQIIHLGKWKFISFVKNVCLPKILNTDNTMSSHIVILALHRTIMKHRLLVL